MTLIYTAISAVYKDCEQKNWGIFFSKNFCYIRLLSFAILVIIIKIFLLVNEKANTAENTRHRTFAKKTEHFSRLIAPYRIILTKFWRLPTKENWKHLLCLTENGLKTPPKVRFALEDISEIETSNRKNRDGRSLELEQ